MVSHGGLLWCIGGYDGLQCTNTVLVYNPQSNRWDFRKPLNVRAGLRLCAPTHTSPQI